DQQLEKGREQRRGGLRQLHDADVCTVTDRQRHVQVAAIGTGTDAIAGTQALPVQAAFRGFDSGLDVNERGTAGCRSA
ncbi:hypothetical protein ACOIC6_28710, partial [Klebsiella pneumoniae]